ncbi:MAG: lipase maturation factor family protein [Acidobacteriota bacterium]
MTEAPLVPGVQGQTARKTGEEPLRYALTRALFLRALGFVYVFAFLSLARQLRPLLGENGILPAAQLLDEVSGWRGRGLSAWMALPTIFWIDASDPFMSACAYLGLALSVAVMLGASNAIVMAALWVLYESFVHVGQVFYGFGWEILLLETGFLAIFLCPLRSLSARGMPPPVPVLVLYRWLVFRVMFGAGLIKMRGDPCWRDLTCLRYHYETQPLPSPLSWVLHRAPPWFHAIEVLWNHLVELPVPFLLFGPRRFRRAAGVLTIGFQLTLIASGNLSWLNYLTIAIAIPCLDDGVLARLLPRRIASLARPHPAAVASPARRVVTWMLVVLVAWLSLGPVANLISRRQVMNTSFDPLDLVNTYGAFGSIGKVRREIVLEGTDAQAIDGRTVWRAYEFPCKPGAVDRRPCVVAPFQWRLDWEMWFAAMSDVGHHPWLLHLIEKLLEGDPAVHGLFAVDPFPDHPPRYIRARLYRYRFTRSGEPGWWHRELQGDYLKPVSLDDEAFRNLLRSYGWY